MAITLQQLTVPIKMDASGFNSVLGNVSKGLLGLGAIAGGVIAGMVKATFDWAESLDKLGDIIGGTKDQVAALAFVAQKSGVGVDTFTASNKKLEGSLLNAWGGLDKTGKKLYEYGINVRDTSGKLKDQATLTEDIAKKYQSLGTQQERVNFLTQIYGKEGAKLVDFFDTLNSEGGISAVEDKVKRLGLAIDPSRYEQFNRNLEELKLIGTGIAVSFTENLMPTLEGVLSYVTDFINAPIEEKLSHLADPLKLLFNFTDWFKNAAANTDWAGLSDELANRIKSVDWAKAGLYIRQGFLNVLQGLYTVLSEVDWGALSDALGTAFKGLIAGLYGYPDWDSFANTVKLGFEYAWNAVKNGFIAFENWVKDGFNRIIDDAEAFVSKIASIFQKVQGFFTQNPGRNVTGGSTPNSNGTGSSNKRASGGAVIAGQAYEVSEFSQHETFIPATNGQIVNSQASQSVDYDRMGRSVAKYLAQMLPSISAAVKA